MHSVPFPASASPAFERFRRMPAADRARTGYGIGDTKSALTVDTSRPVLRRGCMSGVNQLPFPRLTWTEDIVGPFAFVREVRHTAAAPASLRHERPSHGAHR